MISNQEKEIIEKLKVDLCYNVHNLTQNQFDDMVDYIMQNEAKEKNPKELIWRLCGCYENINFNKVIDIFVDSRDAYYVSELASYIGDNLDQKYLTKKLLETNDLKFINDAMSNCGDAMVYSLDQKYIDEIRNFIKQQYKNIK